MFPVKERFSSGEAEIITLEIAGTLFELVLRPGSPYKPPNGNCSHLALYERVRFKIEHALISITIGSKPWRKYFN